MGRVVARRLVTSVVTVFATTIVVFLFRYILPGGPLESVLGASGGVVTPTEIAALKVRLGLNHSAIDQYYIWADNLLHGNLGTSYYSREPVMTIVKQASTPSLELIVGALIVSVIGGCSIGMYSAVRRSRVDGRLLFAATGLGLSIPDFWVATIAAGVLGVGLRIFPAVGYTPLSAGLGANLYSILLPILILSMITGAFIARHMYSSMVETLRSAYVQTAWAMGVPARRVYFRWGFRNAIAPIITFIPLAVAALISGTVIVEDVFNIPGLGTAVVQAVLDQDYPVVQAIVLLAAIVVAVLNLLADVAGAALDPNARLGIAQE